MAQCVYFMEMVGSDFVKIGKAESVVRRMRQLQTHSPLQIKLLGVLGDVTEKEIHKTFHGWHYFGEWFILADELRHWIAGYCTMLPVTPLDKAYCEKLPEIIMRPAYQHQRIPLENEIPISAQPPYIGELETTHANVLYVASILEKRRPDCANMLRDLASKMAQN